MENRLAQLQRLAIAPSQLQAATKVRRRVSLQDDIYPKLKEAATRQNKPMTQLVNEAIKAYLQASSDSQSPPNR